MKPRDLIARAKARADIAAAHERALAEQMAAETFYTVAQDITDAEKPWHVFACQGRAQRTVGRYKHEARARVAAFQKSQGV